MKTNKKVFLIGIISVIAAMICTIIVCISLYIINKHEEANNIHHLNMYYYNKIDKMLSSENIKLHIDDNIIDNIFETLKISPKNNYINVIPKKIKLLGYIIKDNCLYISFSNKYNSLSSVEQMLFRAGLVWSVTELKNISKVKIFIKEDELKNANGEPLGFLSRSNININPVISPDKLKTQNISLYFANKRGTALLPENRIIEIKQNQDKGLQVIEQLILGPTNKNYYKSIPVETKVRNIKTEDGICYIDLSADFVLKQQTIPAKIAIFSVVNSLTELDNVDRVQILIEGEKVELYGNINISKPLMRNKNIIN